MVLALVVREVSLWIGAFLETRSPELMSNISSLPCPSWSSMTSIPISMGVVIWSCILRIFF